MRNDLRTLINLILKNTKLILMVSFFTDDVSTLPTVLGSILKYFEVTKNGLSTFRRPTILAS